MQENSETKRMLYPFSKCDIHLRIQINLTDLTEKVSLTILLQQTREEFTCKQCYPFYTVHKEVDIQKPYNQQDDPAATTEVFF